MHAPTVSAPRPVAADVAEIWERVADLETWPSWAPVRLADGPFELGETNGGGYINTGRDLVVKHTGGVAATVWTLRQARRQP